MAKWKRLKRTFYLEVTVAVRLDPQGVAADTFLRHEIPAVFKAQNWKLMRDTYARYRSIGGPMRNAFYRFEK